MKEEFKTHHEVVNLGNLGNEPQVTSNNFIESDFNEMVHCKAQQSLLADVKNFFKKIFRRNKSE